MRYGLLIIVSFVLMGCGTYANHNREHPLPYGGVRGDCADVSKAFQGENPFNVLLIIDVPLSAVTDTLALPWDYFDPRTR